MRVGTRHIPSALITGSLVKFCARAAMSGEEGKQWRGASRCWLCRPRDQIRVGMVATVNLAS
jgi:hypothetical protein